MKHALQAAIVVGAFVLALAGSSCVTSDMIENSQGQITFEITSTSAAAFPWAKMIVNQMKFHPTTPGALSDPLVLLSSATSIDLSSSSVSANTVRVTATTYALDSFEANFELNVVSSQPSGMVCAGSTVEQLRTGIGQESTIVPSCQFTVPASGTVPILVTVDGAGLAALLVSKLDCGSSNYTAPTSAEILPFLSFQCEP